MTKPASKPIAAKRKTPWSIAWLTLLSVLTLMSASASAQVSVTATAGTPGPTPYVTLGDALTAINAGTHQGDITIDIAANTNEGATPATLNSSGAGSAVYTSVSIRPTADGVSITGNPVTGFGVIQLNGADNVTIDGDNPNSVGINRDLTVVNTNAATAIAGSVIRLATSAAVTSADNNTIKNCILTGNVTSGNASGITSSTGSSNSSFCIYAGGNGGATATSPPTALTSVTSNTAPSGTTINALTVDNNVVNACARAIVFNGAAATVSTGVTIANNTIGGAGALVGAPPYAAPATTVYTKAVYVSGTTAVSITGNTLQNVLSYVGTTMNGIELNSGIGVGGVTISNNAITGVVNNGTSSAANGIVVTSSASNPVVAGNTITNVQTLAGSTVVGIALNHTGTAGTVQTNQVATVYSRGTGGFGAYGINIASGSAWTVENNFVSDVNAFLNNTSISSSFGPHGVRVAAGLNHRIYHNSVNLSGPFVGASSASLSSAFTIVSTGTSLTGIDVRNNVFSNTMTGAFSAASPIVSIFLPSGGTSAMNLTLNNNGYYFGTDPTNQGVGQAGTTAGTNFFTSLPALAAYTSTLSAAGTNDNASFATTTAAPFTSATDLHIPASTVTQLESGGAAVGVTTDIDGDARNATTPDIGADEFAGVAVDLTPPSIAYTPLGATTFTVNRTTAATIADATGVPTAGALQPRIYFTKNAGAYVSTQCLLIGGTGTNGTWDCTIDHSLVGGVVTGDVVSYFVIAQDLAPTPNIASNPAGVVATDVNTVTTPPAVPNAYSIAAPFPASVDVGSGQAITSLTNPGGLFALINAGVLTGNVTVNVTSDLPGETGAVPLNQWVEESGSGYTLTIAPSGGAWTISGTSGAGNTGLIRLNGADRVTIDGSQSGGTDRSLTLTNGNASGVVIWITSASGSNGANNNTVKNCILSGSAGVTAIAGVLSGSSAFGAAADAPNSDNTIQNNLIFRVQNALFLSGNAASLDQNWLITGNAFGSTVAADKMIFRGMLIGGAQNFVVSHNTINGVVSTATSTSTMTGIQVSANINGGSVFQNTISDIKQTNTGGWGSNGIFLAAATTASNVSVYNNFVYDVASYGFNGVGFADNGYGIMIATGGGYTLYHNSVHLNTNQTAATGITAAVNIASTITTPGSVDLRDNILASSQTVGTRYGVYDASTAGAGVFSTIDYNDYSAQNVGFLTSARATLADWQAATGQDAGSEAVDPLFMTATDLHLQPTSPAIAAGTFLASVTTDFDNDPRSTSAPDIGADEVVPAPVDVSIAKTHAGAPAPGQVVVYTVTASAGPRAATAAVADTFPLACSFTAVATGGATGFTASGAGNINDAAVTLPAGSTVTYTATCGIPASATGTLSNTATVTASGVPDSNPANNSATDAYTLVPNADLSVTMIDAPDPVVGLGNLIYIITAANAGPSDAQGVSVVQTLPAGSTFSSLTAVGWSCSTGTGTVTCTLPTLAVGATSTFYVQVTVGPAGGTVTSTATVSGGSIDPNTANNSASEQTTVNGVPYADLSMALTDGGVTVLWGRPLTYTLTVTNNGPDAVTGATVSDSFPPGLAAVSWTCTASAGSSCAAAGSGNVNDTTVALLSGGTATYSATGVVVYGTGTPLVNTATVSASTFDPIAGNNTSTINTPVDGDLVFKDGFQTP